jgi:hypothetical protein
MLIVPYWMRYDMKKCLLVSDISHLLNWCYGVQLGLTKILAIFFAIFLVAVLFGTKGNPRETRECVKSFSLTYMFCF